MSKQTEELLDHNYDGIQEYDNPTPGWWHGLFWLSIVFSFFYWMYFHVGAGWTIEEEHSAAVARRVRMLYGELGTLADDEATLVQYMYEPDWLKVGEAIFVKDCAQCHQKDGSGINGVNLTDDHYKNVRKITDIPSIVRIGANNGAMPAWGTRMHPNDVVLVSSYVATMRGQNLPGRAAEGDVIPPWPDPAPAEAEEAATTTSAPAEAE